MSFRLNFNTVSFNLILASFVFLLLATITTPIVKSLPLSITASHTYGLFGYCDIENTCLAATYPVVLSNVDDSTTNWIFDSDKRDILAKIFIITPIALGFNFILLVLIIISHFVAARAVALITIIVNVLSMLLTIASTVITILAFYPNLAWGGWILIGSGAGNILSLIFLLLFLRVVASDDEDDDDLKSLTELARTLPFHENEKFDSRFTSNNIHPSANSIDKDYDYRGYTTMRNPTSSSNDSTGGAGYGNPPVPVHSASLLNTRPYQSFGANNAKFNDQPVDAVDTTVVAPPSAAGIASTVGGGPGTGRADSFNSSSYSTFSSKPYQYSGKLVPHNYQGGRLDTQTELPQPEFQYNESDEIIPYPLDLNVQTRSNPSSFTTNNHHQHQINNNHNNNSNNNSNNNINVNHDESDMFEFSPQPESKLYQGLEDEYDDDEDDLNNRNQYPHGTDPQHIDEISDNDSDFTSVSQRPPNPQYDGGAYSYPHHQQMAQHHHFQGAPQPMGNNNLVPQVYAQPQPGPMGPGGGPSGGPQGGYIPPPPGSGAPIPVARPSVSETALSNNPDFSIGRPMGNKRKVVGGFVPVAARYNNGTRPGAGARGPMGGATYGM